MNEHFLETIAPIFIAVFTALIGPAAVEYIKLHILGKKENDPIKEELSYSSVINEELESIRSTLKSDRCWILMYHNGGHYLHSKRSMQKFSIMFESCETGVSSVSAIFNNIPVSLYSRSTQELVNNGKVYITDYDDPTISTYGLKGNGEATGTKSSYAVALFDIMNDQCIGSLGVDYLEQTTLNEEELHTLNERSQRVAGYLSNFIKSK